MAIPCCYYHYVSFVVYFGIHRVFVNSVNPQRIPNLKFYTGLEYSRSGLIYYLITTLQFFIVLLALSQSALLVQLLCDQIHKPTLWSTATLIQWDNPESTTWELNLIYLLPFYVAWFHLGRLLFSYCCCLWSFAVISLLILFVNWPVLLNTPKPN